MNTANKKNISKAGLSIILPALNEEKNIGPLIEEIRTHFANSKMNYEIIVVNDGSTDSTGKILDALAAEDPSIHVIHHNGNKGYGISIRDGFDAGRYDYLFYTDADRQFRIKEIDSLLLLIHQENADMVVGYRVDRQDNAFRKFLSWCFNKTICIMFSVECRDIDCAFKLFRKQSYKLLHLSSDDFLIDTEMLANARLNNLRVLQSPVKHYPRAEGESTVSIGKTLANLKKLFSFYFDYKINKKKTLTSR